MEDKKLLLSEFLNLCVSFENEPTEEKQKSIDKFLSDLSVREYMPLSEKAVAAMYIISEISKEDYDVFGATTSLQMAKLYMGLLPYAINLVNDASPIGRTYACYDTCVKFGLYDKILSSCEVDYNRLMKYVDDAINMNNIFKICQTTTIFNEDSKDNWLNIMERIEKTLTPDLLNSLADFNTNKKDFLTNLTTENSKKELLDDKRNLKQFVEDNKEGVDKELN